MNREKYIEKLMRAITRPAKEVWIAKGGKTHTKLKEYAKAKK